VCTTDLMKRDSEVKVLVGCTEDEMRTVCTFHEGSSSSALLIERE
jgi:inorganic pyrophosphatase